MVKKKKQNYGAHACFVEIILIPFVNILVSIDRTIRVQVFEVFRKFRGQSYAILASLRGAPCTTSCALPRASAFSAALHKTRRRTCPSKFLGDSPRVEASMSQGIFLQLFMFCAAIKEVSCMGGHFIGYTREVRSPALRRGALRNVHVHQCCVVIPRGGERPPALSGKEVQSVLC